LCKESDYTNYYPYCCKPIDVLENKFSWQYEFEFKYEHITAENNEQNEKFSKMSLCYTAQG